MNENIQKQFSENLGTFMNEMTRFIRKYENQPAHDDEARVKAYWDNASNDMREWHEKKYNSGALSEVYMRLIIAAYETLEKLWKEGERES